MYNALRALAYKVEWNITNIKMMRSAVVNIYFMFLGSSMVIPVVVTWFSIQCYVLYSIFEKRVTQTLNYLESPVPSHPSMCSQGLRPPRFHWSPATSF